MLNTKKTPQDFSPRQSLYCVWIRATEAANARLVSVWIDSEMTAFEARSEETPGNSRVVVRRVDACTAQEEDEHPPARVGGCSQTFPGARKQVYIAL